MQSVQFVYIKTCTATGYVFYGSKFFISFLPFSTQYMEKMWSTILYYQDIYIVSPSLFYFCFCWLFSSFLLTFSLFVLSCMWNTTLFTDIVFLLILRFLAHSTFRPYPFCLPTTGKWISKSSEWQVVWQNCNEKPCGDDAIPFYGTRNGNIIKENSKMTIRWVFVQRW